VRHVFTVQVDKPDLLDRNNRYLFNTPRAKVNYILAGQGPGPGYLCKVGIDQSINTCAVLVESSGGFVQSRNRALCYFRSCRINDQFMKDLATTLPPGSAALCVLVQRATPDKVLDEIASTPAPIKTTL